MGKKGAVGYESGAAASEQRKVLFMQLDMWSYPRYAQERKEQALTSVTCPAFESLGLVGDPVGLTCICSLRYSLLFLTYPIRA